MERYFGSTAILEYVGHDVDSSGFSLMVDITDFRKHTVHTLEKSIVTLYNKVSGINGFNFFFARAIWKISARVAGARRAKLQ